MKKIILCIVLMFFLVGCSIFGGNVNSIVKTSGHLNDLKAPKSLNNDISSDVNSFAIDLYNKLYKEDKNVFLSPVSIYLALGMTYNGANGNTATQMANILRANDLSLTEFNERNLALQSLIGYKNSKFMLANSIWLRNTFENSVKQSFIDNNKKYFGAMIASLDFNSAQAKDTINNWVKNNTKGLIKEVIDHNIDSSAVMYLINTIYFKANWEYKFDKADTHKATFKTNKSSTKVDMMNQLTSLYYLENNDLQAVLLPYDDNKTSMLILLPKDNIKVNDLKIDVNSLNGILTTMKNQKKVAVNISLPKIKLEYNTKLIEPLKELGMTDAFSSEAADFSNMADVTEGDLYIGEAVHKSFLQVDEEGTKAAAVTNIGMNLTSAEGNQGVKMYVDHPFVLGIVDNKTGVISFIGSIVNPQ